MNSNKKYFVTPEKKETPQKKRKKTETSTEKKDPVKKIKTEPVEPNSATQSTPIKKDLKGKQLSFIT